MAEIVVHNGKTHIRGGVEAFSVLKDVLEGRIEVKTSFSPPIKSETEKEKPVRGASRAPVKPEGKGGSISKEEMQKIQQIIKEVISNGK